MKGCEFLRQEILLEIVSDTLGNSLRFERKNNISLSNSTDPINVMYSLAWNTKRRILCAGTASKSDRIGLDWIGLEWNSNLPGVFRRALRFSHYGL